MLSLVFGALIMIGALAQSPSVAPPSGGPSPQPPISASPAASRSPASRSPAPSPVIPPLRFIDSTLFPIVGNYTMGYVNTTQENRCHRATLKFQAQNTGLVDMLKMGVYSQAAPETCGISFVLSTFPGGVAVGSSLLTTFTDLVAAVPGTDEFVKFNATPSSWSVVAGDNYTITILPFTWASSPSGTIGTPTHCVFQIPYGRPGLPYASIGQYGPTAQPCGSSPWTTDLAGDGYAIQILLNGHAAQVNAPSASSTPTPTPTSTHTPTPSSTGTPTPSATPTGTPTITDTPTPTLSPGATASNSPTSTRTPSRTPSISYSPSPTSSITPSPTPTETPTATPTLRIGASPSVTPTETPGPTDSPSPTHSVLPIGALAAGTGASAPSGSFDTGHVVGAAIGGALVIVAAIGIAIRLRLVHAELNPDKYNKKSKIKITLKDPNSIDSHHTTTINPSASVVLRVNSMKRSKFEPVKVSADGVALEKTRDY